MNNKDKLFLSYARADDGTFVKRLYEDLAKHGFEVWWDRACMPSRALTFLQEIRDAVEASDRLIAIIGPNALESDYVQAEWEHAFLFCKGVVPVLRIGNYNLVPEQFSKLHCPDFRKERPYHEAFEELLRILAEQVPPLGPLLTMIPALPPHFISRREEMAELSQLVLADVQRPTVITSIQQTTALQGMGGIGKSVLAAAFARSAEARRSFTDGVLWLSIGQRSDLLRNISTVGVAFDNDSADYVDLQKASARLSRILADKVCLIVLDDVWGVRDAEPFVNALGPRCRLLITTREGSLVTALDAQEQNLNVLSDVEALRLIADWCGQEESTLPSEAKAAMHECGNLPLALSLCGAMARDGSPWSDLLDALREADLTFVKERLPNYPYPDILRSLKVSVDVLAHEHPEGVKHYHELAVLPADETIPEAAVMTLWLHTDGLKERNARILLTLMGRKSLLT